MAANLINISLELKLNRCFKRVSSKQGIKRQSKSFLKNTLLQKSLDNNRKRAERKQQEYNNIDWEDLYHRNQLSSLRVGELKLYFNHHNVTFKGKKDEKVRVVKAHIGSKIFTSIVQDCQNNIQPASDSNSESDSDSDMVECMVQINDSGDLAANSQQGQEAEETIPESGTS